MSRLSMLPGKVRPHVLPLFFLAAVTVAVYGRIVGHDFIFNWDDNRYVVENSAIQGFSWQHLREIFTSSYVGNYAPLQMLSYMVDYQLWGLRAGGFLCTNIVLHVANGLLFYRLLIRWYDDRLLAVVAAAVFLLHPVQVESVAWVSQRKNLLAMLFCLLAWEGYCRYRDSSGGSGRPAYAASLAAFIGALLAKSVVVVFPLILFIHDYCFAGNDRRFRGKDKIPFLLAALVVAALTVYIQRTEFGGGRADFHGGSPWVTFLTMLTVLCRYLGMLLWPVGLSAVYAPPIHAGFDGAVALSALVIAGTVAAGGFLFYTGRRLGFWVLSFFIWLLPVSQIVPLVTLMNDRYLYFPLLAAAACAGTGVVFLRDHFPRQRRLLQTGAGCAVLLLALVSFQRTAVWRTPLTLWSDAVAKSPTASYGWSSLAEVYFRDLKVPEAIQGYERSLGLDPQNRMAVAALGPIYTELGQLDKGQAMLQRFLELRPEDAKGWAYLGINQLRRGNSAEAERLYKKALALQPDSLKVIYLLGDLALERKQFAEALDYFGKAEAVVQNDPETAYRLACTAAQAGRSADSLAWLEKALLRGYRNYDRLYDDQRLSPLWNDPRFTMLLSQYFPQNQ